MSAKRATPPAFPVPPKYDIDVKQVGGADGGMSLRDYFAAHALVGIVTSFTGSAATAEAMGSAVTAVKLAYEFADAMVAEREQ